MDAAGAAVSISSAADADAAAPGSSLCIAPAVDHAAANPAAALPAVGPAAARPAAAEPAVDMLAVDPAAAKPAVSNPTATDAASDAAPASGGCAAAAAPRSAQIGTEPKPVNGSSKGISAGDYEVVPVADYLEQLKDPHKRRLSDGATSVVNLRVDPYHLLGPFCIHVRCAVGQHILVFRWQQAAIMEILHKPKHLTCMMMPILCQPQVNTLLFGSGKIPSTCTQT